MAGGAEGPAGTQHDYLGLWRWSGTLDRIHRIATLFGLHPFLTRIYADAGYQGPSFADAVKQAMGRLQIEIVKRSELHRFVVLPKRWLVERTIAWLNRCRRLSEDWENHSRNALAFPHLALIRLMLRKLCNSA